MGDKTKCVVGFTTWNGAHQEFTDVAMEAGISLEQDRNNTIAPKEGTYVATFRRT